MAKQAGYSGKPLSEKLGLKTAMTCWWHNVPDDISSLLHQQVPGLKVQTHSEGPFACAHLFSADKSELSEVLTVLRHRIAQDGMIWVSWPKKSSGVPSTVTEDVVRELCLPLGLVDVKVCAIDEIWSGLKLVIRKELRPG